MAGVIWQRRGQNGRLHMAGVIGSDVVKAGGCTWQPSYGGAGNRSRFCMESKHQKK